ncbi:hypothetical protein [Streptomyces sp. NPDC046727]|uniref:hypothetical protein n=1 Tax=Streptomyces sp. NPDC046727 TaxID=3155373 RepID=UPI0033FFA970
MRAVVAADVAHLMLSDIDVSECRFAGTIHLDQLRLEVRCPLATTQSGWHCRVLAPVRWTQRQALAEELHWRAAREPARGDWNSIPNPDGPVPLEPTAPAPVHRALRKAFEDAKDEPAPDVCGGSWPERGVFTRKEVRPTRSGLAH